MASAGLLIEQLIGEQRIEQGPGAIQVLLRFDGSGTRVLVQQASSATKLAPMPVD